jgi:putative DNA primase/helicase
VELMDYLQRVCGYLLTASVSEECLFFMYGDGRNGKSVMVETIKHVMGEYAGVAEPDLIMARQNSVIPVDVAALRGTRAVFMNETEQNKRFDEAKLKNLTGGDSLQARFMRENLFTFKPTHKLVLRGNHKPTVSGTDEGIWSRLRLIPFDLRLTPEQRDQRLKETLSGESAGILAWMVEGCIDWQRNGLKTPQIILDAVAAYRSESDSVGKFLDEACTLGANCQVKSSAIYSHYRSWCEKAGERYLSNKDFPSELEKRGISRRKSDGVIVFSGVEIKREFNELENNDNWRF